MEKHESLFVHLEEVGGKVQLEALGRSTQTMTTHGSFYLKASFISH